MPRDVTTRWNSSFDMLDFAPDYRPAVDAIIDEKEMKLRQYELSDKDWKIVKQLRDVLKVCPSPFIPPIVINLRSQIFKDATMFFSWAQPNLAGVIPAMDRISTQLNTDATDAQYSPSIHTAVKEGKDVLSKYYKLTTDESEIYRISTGMFSSTIHCDTPVA